MSIFTNKYKELQLAIELSAQPSRAALTTCFVDILNDLYNLSSVALYRPEHGLLIEAKRNQALGNVRVFDYLAPAGSAVVTLQDIPGAFRCANGNSPVEMRADGYTTSFLPIRGCGGICEILTLDHRLKTLLDQELLMALIVLFENLLNIFNLAERDGLTNLLNRKAFDKTISQIHDKEQLYAANRSDEHFIYLALIDIDHFKKVNDQYGHLYGDEILIGFAHLLQQSFRRQDWIFRYGGEEFAAIIEDISPQHIDTVLNRFRKHVQRHRFPLVGKITISIGCARISGENPPHLTVDNADKALYYSKDHGRNQAAVYESLVHKGQVIPQPITKHDITFFNSKG